MPTGDGDRNALVASALIMPISSALPPNEVASPPRAEEVAPTVAAAEAVSGADVPTWILTPWLIPNCRSAGRSYRVHLPVCECR
ncbi:hypothetical protein HNQ75_004174 [Rhizobium flavum]|uniref:Uncharacterized protein n=1 Tax=Pseudorhizobium flavum TaxID=1335061 RepID=A0A7W9Z193_9HYPH|nr:hypothetical protein [Pseudorhizobium flavum]CAD6630529.1 hypothetical protein RFYW14_04284 [Pseudorhizobium flavum]